MADLLLNRVINNEIDSNVFNNWLSNALQENVDEFKEILARNVAQIDFVTYFLNFIHEEVPCHNKLGETPQKVNTPKRIDKIQVHTSNAENKAVKPNLFVTVDNVNSHHNCSLNSTLDNSIGKNSTPKVGKTPNRNNSYYSPVSPLYQNQNSFGSKESKNGNSLRQSAEKYSLCLGDFIVVNSKSSSKKKRLNIDPPEDKKEASRRIKPTSIFPKQVKNEFQKTENSFNFQQNVAEVPVETAVEQRCVLVEERMKILSRKDSLEKNTHPLLTKRHTSSPKLEVSPSLSEVTFKTHIDCVVSIYTTILKNKMVLNITSEIYFLISLLLSKQPECLRRSSKVFIQDQINEDLNLGVNYLDQFPKILESIHVNQVSVKSRLYNSEIFETIHNVVYFAVKCLEGQIEVIKMFDKNTIRLLAENERFLIFSPHFSKKLSTYAEKVAEKPCVEPVTPISQTNVCFIMDTDSKDNFPDQNSFHAFRKQRDLFYEILRVWETNHLSSDWNFSVRLSGKIKSLFSLNWEPTNYIHLARLFKNQLLSNCAKGPKEKGLSDNNLSFLPSVNIDPDKLNRLTNRLVTKQSSNGINSLPVFNGYQEFYRDFIVVASNHFFNKHLGDNLVSEIIDLNDTKFSGIDLEEDGNDVDPSIRKRYVSCIKNLRILAKFLGFIESLPYRSEYPNLSKNILESQIKLRKQCVPALDLQSILNKSIKTNSLVLVVPWLTKYLAMLDYVTIRLPYYNSVLKILFDIYQNCENSEKYKYNVAVIKFSLGWLFELPHFPDSEYFNYCLKIGLECNSENQENELCLREGINGTRVKLKNKGLDQLNIVNQGILYLCCPYLEEIKKLLSMNASSSNVSVKYITPVTAVESNSGMARKKLEQQLEDAFFSGQPASLRKTIEFISERIASSAVKYICHDLVPQAKEAALKDLKENVLKNYSVEKFADDPQKKTLLRKQATSLAQSHLSILLRTCNREAHKISHQKIIPAIDSLLPIDSLDETKHVCVGITDKIYTERVNQWLNSHVNLTVFTKDFDSEVQKVINGRKTEKDKAPFVLPPAGRDCSHNEDSLSGFHLLNNIRETCCNLTEETDIDETNIINLLQETYKSLTERNDINDMITANIYSTLFDLCLLLVSNNPSIFTSNNDTIDHFIRIWSLQKNPQAIFKSLFCPRNITILQKSSLPLQSWNAYAKALSYLMETNLIGQEDVETQCTGFYNRDWDQDILENFSNFLKNFISYSNCDSSDSSFAYLLDFLSDFCSDL